MTTTFKFLGPVWTLLLIAIALMFVLVLMSAVAEVTPAIENLALQTKGRLTDVNTSNSHGEEKHGTELVRQIRHCIDKGGHIQTWYRPKDDHWIEVCMLDDELFGLRICRDNPDCGFDERTAFSIKGSIDKVEEYLIGSEYMDITPP